MAEGFARDLKEKIYKDKNLLILSAGVSPKPVNPLSVKVMAEKDIDLTNYKSKSLDDIDLTNADSVFKRTGFKVYFGSVYAEDIKAYLNSDRRKTQEMREIKFSMLDRLILTPREIIPAMNKFIIFAAIILLFFGIQPTGILFKSAWVYGEPFLLLGLVSIIAGSFITPAALPFIPFRSFALKGWITGILLTAPVIFLFNSSELKNILIFSSAILFFPMASSYLALQFTGSTTFTNMSGVKKELKTALPVYLISTVISIVLLIIYKLHKLAVI